MAGVLVISYSSDEVKRERGSEKKVMLRENNGPSSENHLTSISAGKALTGKGKWNALEDYRLHFFVCNGLAESIHRRESKYCTHNTPLERKRQTILRRQV